LGIARPGADRRRADTSVDVVVLGDGPAGCVAALTLAENGARVALLGRRHRASAAHWGQCLPAQGWTWMRALGLAAAFRTGPHLPIVANRSAWSNDRIETEDLIRGPHGHSWMLDRDAFDRLLRDAAIAKGALHRRLYGRVRLEATDGWRLRFRDGDRAWVLNADFAIDAGGRAANLALRYGARRRSDDRLVALIGCYDGQQDDVDQTTLIEAFDQGWWYSCRLGLRRRVVSLFTDGDLLPRAAERAEFMASRLRAARHLQPLLAAHGYARHAPPKAVLANSTRLERPAGERWLAAGDAAASYDPLCGHGVIAAMDSGRHAAAALIDHAQGDDFALGRHGDLQAERYAWYLRELAESYSAQQRWPTSVFWSRRRQR
jgi:flavin-dependent dehydrogenase